MPTLKTTTRSFKEGLAVKGDNPTIEWESTGHLHVRLMDASGTVPLAGLEVHVDIPREGSVTLTTDPDGVVFHPDVPFLDYRLALPGGAGVTVPTVGTRGEQHLRHVPEVRRAFVNAQVLLERGRAARRCTIQVSLPDGQTLEARTDATGALFLAIDTASEGAATLRLGERQAQAPLTASPQRIVSALLEGQP